MNPGDPKNPSTPSSVAISLALVSSTSIVIGWSAPPMVSIPSNQVLMAASISSNFDRRVGVEFTGYPSRARFKSRARSDGLHVRFAAEREMSLGKAARSDRHV